MTSISPTSAEMTPPWMQALNPTAFARAWFDQTGFARRAEMRLAATTVDDNNWRDVLLPVAQDLLAEGRESIRNRFLKDNDGAIYIGGMALIMDSLLKAVFTRITRDQHKPLTLIATGGYGRGELAPASDIDLLFLTPKQADQTVGITRGEGMGCIGVIGGNQFSRTKPHQRFFKPVSSNLFSKKGTGAEINPGQRLGTTGNAEGNEKVVFPRRQKIIFDQSPRRNDADNSTLERAFIAALFCLSRQGICISATIWGRSVTGSTCRREMNVFTVLLISMRLLCRRIRQS